MGNPKALKFLRLDPQAILPVRGSPLAAGLDLHALEAVDLRPGQRIAVKTGLAVQIPEGFYGRIAPRSSLAAKNGLDVLAGVIDSDYRGEILCVLVNLGQEAVSLSAGSRVAQLIVEAIATPDPEWATDLDETNRGASGFGSSDV